jgi:hypothetical protein
MFTHLKSISDVVAQLKSEARRMAKTDIAYRRKQMRDRIDRVERNRQALALLDGLGLNPTVSKYDDLGEYITLDLGVIYRRKRDRRAFVQKLHDIRVALSCRFEVAGKSLKNPHKREVEVTLKPKDYDGVNIRYIDQLPKRGSKCRIVKERQRATTYHRLVCEN